MARLTHNNCADTCTAPGTGDFVLLGVIPSNSSSMLVSPRIASSIMADQDAPDYLAVDSSNNAIWEEGYGTFTLSTLHLTRNVLTSSNSNALVNFTGGVNLYLTYNNNSGLPWKGASTLIDLGASPVGWTARDINIGATAITATVKPASPTFTYTVVSGDIPTSSRIANCQVLFSLYGQNTSGVTHTVNWRFTLNGTDIGTADNFMSPSAASPYWYANGVFQANAINVGDVLGVKLWVDSASTINYIGNTIYFLPRVYNIPSSPNEIGYYPGTTNNGITIITGALAGVTYVVTTSNLFAQGNGIIDTALSVSPAAGPSPGACVYPENFTPKTGAFADSNNVASSFSAVITLLKPNNNANAGNSVFSRYFRVFQFTT